MSLRNIPFQQIGALFQTPVSHPANVISFPSVKQVFYESVPYHGKTTRVFACYSLPDGASEEHPVPGVVLVHGGGATALADWVKLWNSRGYAAISMDTCGKIPCWSPSPYYYPWPAHEYAGPHGWGRMDESLLPVEEQWPYHAVCAVIAGHSFLRSLPGVDPARIGITGISWGGVLTCMTAGLDDRFRFAAPVYGCGFWNQMSSSLAFETPGLTQEQKEKWFSLWEPGIYLPNAKMPFLFFTGTNDFAFPPDALQKSFDVLQSEYKRIAMKTAYPHNHTASWKEETIFNFADSVLNGRIYPSFSPIRREGNRLMVDVQCERKIRSTAFHFTRAEGYWQDRVWNTMEPQCSGNTLSVVIPHAATAAYFNLFDSEDCCSSSSLFIFK